MTQPPVPEAGVPTCYRHPGRESHIKCQRCERPICPDCMRDAAVGFQCPECVAEGARSTRQARTAYGGRRPANAGATSIGLIAVNVAVWIAVMATGGSSSRLVDYLALRPRGLCLAGDAAYDVGEGHCAAGGGTWLPGVSDAAWWQPVTSMFAHVELWHIGFNMLALWVLGPQLELVLGRARFLALYLLSGLTGSVLVYWLSGEYLPTLGASTAIFGLMGALLVVALKVGGQVQQILLWLGINAVITFTIPNVSWQGHLGGFLGGVAVSALLVLAPRGRVRTPVQAAGLALVAVVVVGAIVTRTAVLA